MRYIINRILYLLTSLIFIAFLIWRFFVGTNFMPDRHLSLPPITKYRSHDFTIVGLIEVLLFLVILVTLLIRTNVSFKQKSISDKYPTRNPWD